MRKIISTHRIGASALCNIIDAMYGHPDFDLKQLRDALSTGQIGSKLWLIDELLKLDCPDEPKILIVGGWIGTLARLIFEKIDAQIVSIDIDDQATQIAKDVNRSFPFLAKTQDMYDLLPSDYSEFDIVINTSCEHIENVTAWSNFIPLDKIVIAQSNDFIQCKEHINCVKSEEELIQQLSLREIFFAGKLTLPGMYTRFMVIGKK